MSQRIYRVQFEVFESGQWIGNALTRDVAVVGGAEQAIKVAVQREKKGGGNQRVRVQSVALLAAED